MWIFIGLKDTRIRNLKTSPSSHPSVGQVFPKQSSCFLHTTRGYPFIQLWYPEHLEQKRATTESQSYENTGIDTT